MVLLDKMLYVGGANEFGSRFCPVLMKIDSKNLKHMWGYAMPYCKARDYSGSEVAPSLSTSNYDDGTIYSMAIDMLITDQFNDFVYGLIVARDKTNIGDLALSKFYWLVILKGNGAEPYGRYHSNNFLPTCTNRRLHIVQIEPFKK
jgi:hypothetical protein